MANACILYPGCVDRRGYARRTVQGKQTRAHRQAWIEAFGPIPEGMLVCHHCDVRNCVNLEHLFLGTHADNVADMVAKGRMRTPRGEKRYNAKLTDEILQEIRRSTEPTSIWARRLGLDASTISRARRGLKWRHLQEV